jgi:hypothetical protein
LVISACLALIGETLRERRRNGWAENVGLEAHTYDAADFETDP